MECVQDLVATEEEELKLFIAHKMRMNSKHEFTRHLLRGIFMGNIQESNELEVEEMDGGFESEVWGILV